MENRSSKKFLQCCGTRTWSLGIGVFITVFSVIILIYDILRFSYNPALIGYGLPAERDITDFENENDWDEYKLEMTQTRKHFKVRMGILIAAYFISFTAGIFLIVGVIKKSSIKVKISLIMQILFVAFPFNVLLIGVFAGGGYDAFDMHLEFIVIIVSIAFVFIVRVHLKELLAINAM